MQNDHTSRKIKWEKVKNKYQSVESKTDKKNILAITNAAAVFVNPKALFENVFNCEIMHTNFALTNKEIMDICEVPGIETMDVFTKYRAKVGFAPLFDADVVKEAVAEKLIKQVLSKEEEVRKILEKKFEGKYCFMRNDNTFYGNSSIELVNIKIKETEEKGGKILWKNF